MEHGKLKRDGVHERDRRDDEAHRRAGEELRERHDPRRFRDAVVAVPEVRRRGAREVQEVPVHEVRLRVLEDPGGRQLEPAEAETLLRDREVGPLEGFRSKLGRPVRREAQAERRATRCEFDFGQRTDDDGDEAPDFTGQDAARRRARSAAATCSRRPTPTSASAPSARARRCDFRSGRMILSAAHRARADAEAAATGKTDLLQFVSTRTQAAVLRLSRAPDRRQGRLRVRGARSVEKGRPQRGGTPLRIVGAHPADGAPVELHAGRYGPYVKHGGVNATVPAARRISTRSRSTRRSRCSRPRAASRPRPASRRCAPRRRRRRRRRRSGGHGDGVTARRHGRRRRRRQDGGEDGKTAAKTTAPLRRQRRRRLPRSRRRTSPRPPAKPAAKATSARKR